MDSRYSETVTVRLSPEQKSMLEKAREMESCSTRKLLMTAVKLALRQKTVKTEPSQFQKSVDELIDGILQP